MFSESLKPTLSDWLAKLVTSPKWLLFAIIFVNNDHFHGKLHTAVSPFARLIPNLLRRFAELPPYKTMLRRFIHISRLCFFCAIMELSDRVYERYYVFNYMTRRCLGQSSTLMVGFYKDCPAMWIHSEDKYGSDCTCSVFCLSVVLTLQVVISNENSVLLPWTVP